MREHDRSNPKSEVRELSWTDFDGMVQSIARKVQRSFKPEAVVGVAHGGVFVGGAMASALACEFYPVRISRRSRDKRTKHLPRMYGSMPKELKGKRVLVVDDVAASGQTLELACSLAKKVGAKQVATCSLVARETEYQPEWTALSTDDLVIFPWDYEPLTVDGRFEVSSSPFSPSKR